MKEIIFLVDEDPEGGFTARALGHSIFTEADTWEDLRRAIQDAVKCHFESDERPMSWSFCNDGCCCLG
ncbi:MAG: 2-oxoisovalerate dehydrogenase [Anaerolineae bacterium]